MKCRTCNTELSQYARLMGSPYCSLDCAMDKNPPAATGELVCPWCGAIDTIDAFTDCQKCRMCRNKVIVEKHTTYTTTKASEA